MEKAHSNFSLLLKDELFLKWYSEEEDRIRKEYIFMVFSILLVIMLRGIYDRCKSSFLGKVFYPLRYWVTGKPVIKTAQMLEENSFLPKDEIYERKMEKIINLLKFCEEYVPYYQDLFKEKNIVVSRIKDIETFESEIPTLTKKQLQMNFDKLKATTTLYPPLIYNSTGGSTGAPTRFIQDSNYWLYCTASEMRNWQWCGWKPWEKRAYIWGSERDLEKGMKASFIINFINNRFMLNSFRMDKENMLDFYKQINRKRPKLIIGYANSLKIFAHFILSQNLEFKNSDFNLESSAEVLTGESRAMIEKAFNAKVFNSYGSREIAAIAHECNYFDGLHVNEERMHLEGIPMNETKKVALTDLTNFAFPLIRYENGDLFEKFDDSPCKCGRSLIRIKNIIGRTSDNIKTPNGSIVHGEYFTRHFYYQDLILEIRLVQDALDHVLIEYVPSGKNKSLIPDFLKKVKRDIHDQIDPSLKIDFVEKEYIERTASGKYRYTKSLINEE